MNIAVLLPEVTLFCGGLFILLLDIFFAKKIKSFFYITHLLALVICGISIGLSFNNNAKALGYDGAPPPVLLFVL
jgi:NADH:ubiquinone oxidoreductase subunit 2 (subunit N)